jgi:hypothetical protein
MLRVLLSMVLLGFGVGFVRAQDDDDDPPAKYTNKAGKYAIAFPAKAKVKTMKQENGPLTMYTASCEQDGKAFVVMYADFPDEVKDVPAKTLFDGAQKGAAGDGGKVVSSKDITVGKQKYPGRDIVVDKSGTKLKTRMVLANVRLYVIIVGGEDDFATSKEAQKFLDSFEILK